MGAKEKFEEQDDVVAADAEPVDEAEYVDPSVEQVEGEEEEEFTGQKVALGLHPFGVQVQVTSRDGTTALTTLNPEEANNLAGNLLALSGFHMQMALQQQMAEQAAVQEMLARGVAPGEKRTKSGIIVR